MELHFRTLFGDLHYAFCGFPQATEVLHVASLFAAVALLARGRAMGMRRMRRMCRVFRAGLRRSRFALGSVLCFRLCGCMLLTCGVAHCGSGVGFVVTL